MGKKKNTHVSIKRGAIQKEVPIEQWNAMKANAYGWKLASDVSDETLDKEKEIVSTKITELEGTVKTLTADNSEKDAKITELEGTVKTLNEQIDNLKADASKSPSKDGDKKNTGK